MSLAAPGELPTVEMPVLGDVPPAELPPLPPGAFSADTPLIDKARARGVEPPQDRTLPRIQQARSGVGDVTVRPYMKGWGENTHQTGGENGAFIAAPEGGAYADGNYAPGVPKERPAPAEPKPEAKPDRHVVPWEGIIKFGGKLLELVKKTKIKESSKLPIALPAAVPDEQPLTPIDATEPTVRMSAIVDSPNRSPQSFRVRTSVPAPAPQTELPPDWRSQWMTMQPATGSAPSRFAVQPWRGWAAGARRLKDQPTEGIPAQARSDTEAAAVIAQHVIDRWGPSNARAPLTPAHGTQPAPLEARHDRPDTPSEETTGTASDTQIADTDREIPPAFSRLRALNRGSSARSRGDVSPEPVTEQASVDQQPSFTGTGLTSPAPSTPSALVTARAGGEAAVAAAVPQTEATTPPRARGDHDRFRVLSAMPEIRRIATEQLAHEPAPGRNESDNQRAGRLKRQTLAAELAAAAVSGRQLELAPERQATTPPWQTHEKVSSGGVLAKILAGEGTLLSAAQGEAPQQRTGTTSVLPKRQSRS